MKKLRQLIFLVSICLFASAFGPAKKALQQDKNPAPKKKIVFIAGACTHKEAEHEGNAGSLLLAGELKAAMPGTFETVVYAGSWPSDPHAFDNAAAIVMYMDGGMYHLSLPHLAQLDSLAKRGVGIVCLHYAVEVPMGKPGNYFLDWIGGYFEQFWSVNPMWMAEFKTMPKHPVTNGVMPFSIYDEWYYHMRFRKNMEGVTPVLTAIPPAYTLDRPEGTHTNNKYVRAEAGQPQHMAWVSTNAGGGRGFGFTGGHFHQNWADNNFRKLVLNGIAWTAGVDIPKSGLVSPTPSESELLKNLDKKPCAVAPPFKPTTGVCIGNSTVAGYLGGEAIASLLFTPNEVKQGYSCHSLAVPGHTINQQLDLWQKYAGKSQVDWIIVEIGLNDLQPADPVDSAISRYQHLIDIIRATKKPGAKIILATMTPAKQRLKEVYKEDAAISYDKWIRINDAIMGKGPHAITGADHRFNDHTLLLIDEKGNLRSEFEVARHDHIHENTAARMIIAARWRLVLTQLGLFEVTGK